MDCCNYVEPYTPGTHFYQQQQHHHHHHHQLSQQQQQQQQGYFCYNNASVAPYTNYGAAPITNMLEANARYNAVLPPAYHPTDYVYNPKEARLRKAMREQSRESSRRSILQNAIANARNGIIGDSTPAPTTTTSSSLSSAGDYLNQQRHHLDCGGPNVPSFQGEQFIDSTQQHHQHHQRPMQEPWFQISKSGYTTRDMDWYATSNMDSDAEQRSRLAMQQRHQQQQQQRAIEKPSTEVARSQAAAAAATVAAAAAVECASAFSTGGYSTAFKDNPNLERELNRRQEVSGNYALAEFPDGQKWHPYQNNANPHQHARVSHLSSQIGNVHHGNGQEAGFHGPWSQFSHGMPSHVPGMVRNVAIRGVRQAIFLRDRMSNRHCNFTEDPSRISYIPRKHDVEDARASYPLQKHQMPVEPIVGSTPVMPRRREKHEEPRWEANPVPNSMSLDGLVSSTTEMTSKGDFPRDRDKEYERRSAESFEPSKKPISKQPLPGFHQAFGSTEIGRFSRSEYFVNMVGDKNTTTIGEDNKNGDIPEACLSHNLPTIFPFPPTCQGALKTPAECQNMKRHDQFFSRSVHDDYYWFAKQAGHSIMKFSNSDTICTRPLDCVRHTNAEHNFYENATFTHLSNIEALLRRYGGKCCILINEEDHVEDQKYILIGTDNSTDNSSYIEEEEEEEDAPTGGGRSVTVLVAGWWQPGEAFRRMKIERRKGRPGETERCRPSVFGSSSPDSVKYRAQVLRARATRARHLAS
ncbi:hypothetical protein KPH14_004195 [Odynerus spinipes]|uniref:Uncharacterized protein n=1 Tax=Odynerus spinipes TaxID=1348599 RepID=A0AAD9RYV6_9HYME|nr:hypothetical protein KPH14_004195 [Odynerus spinipes]